MKAFIATSMTALLAAGMLLSQRARSEAKQDSPAHQQALVPVESDVHEFMEYAFEPFFEQLKASLQQAPADRKSWVPVKANALVLAEAGNLLMLRGPEEHQQQWDALAVDLRDHGQTLYQAAKKRDYAVAREAYVTFVAKCNACHEKFADGEHIQQP